MFPLLTEPLGYSSVESVCQKNVHGSGGQLRSTSVQRCMVDLLTIKSTSYLKYRLTTRCCGTDCCKLTYPGHLDWPWPSPWNGPFDQVAVDVCSDTTSVRRCSFPSPPRWPPSILAAKCPRNSAQLLSRGVAPKGRYTLPVITVRKHGTCLRPVNTGSMYRPSRYIHW